ncbi:MAG: aminopeptidase [Clostridiales bacterium]|nr:aminopeptidase [Clostridiales bacterium]
MADKKTEVELLSEKLFNKKENAVQRMTAEQIKTADDFCEGYKDFLNASRTEREATEYFVALAQQKGFEEFAEGKKYKAGSKIYKINRGKSVMLAVIGKQDIKKGVRIAAAHIDSPRLDLKPCPLYEDSDEALFKTHYYGGIKKYQWTAIPLALHGVIIKKNGETVKVSIGDDASDTRFVVTDLLPHLAAEQMERKLNNGIKGEELNILVGSRPFKSDSEGELVKLNIMKLLNEKYGIVESDFLSAELEAVPAFSASDIGFDRSMIGSYGHDDRVCAYPAAMAALDAKAPEYTLLAVLTDKEETGSDGNTGLNSSYMKYFINDLAKLQGADGYEVLRNSACLSADVNAAFDPTFPDVADKNNFAFINRGVVVTKYTGRAGKSGTSDASAEFVGKVRRIFDNAGVIWQTGELGKVDIGGGGTVAKYIANLDVDVVDVGVPVLSMHAPFEVVSKIDVYMTYRACAEFFAAD